MTSAHDITEAMITFGGSFVQLLGRCYRAADNTNQSKLAAAFPEYFAQYREIAVLQAARKGQTAGAVDPHANSTGTPTPREKV